MPGERKVAKQEHGVRVKGIDAKREQQQPYASELEDYASDVVRSPHTDPRRQPKEATHGDARSGLNPLTSGQRSKKG